MTGSRSDQHPSKIPEGLESEIATARPARETASEPKKSWLKSKGTKLFSSPKSSKSATSSTGTVSAESNNEGPSQDKAGFKVPLTGSPSQPPVGEPTAEESAETLISRPIAEIWDDAYDELRKKDRSLVDEYEAQLSKTLVGAIAAGQASAIAFSGLGKIQRYQQMKVLLDQKIKEIEDGAWKLKFKNHELAVKDLVGPVVGVIDWAKDFVGTALATSPYGSIAWAGVCLLLPLVLNPSNQEAARVKALDDIAKIMSQCVMREALYRRRYESTGHNESTREFVTSQTSYRDALRALYVKILSFQATSFCFLSKNTFARATADMLKWNDWNIMIAEIKEQENAVQSIEEQWRDMKYDEECKLQNDRHEQRMRGLGAIEDEVSRVRRVIMQAQNDNEREKLLKWLSSVDPSTNYNSARRSHALSTGDWLVGKSSDFKNWEKSSNSLLWLYGKAGAGKSFLSSVVIHYLKKSYDSDPYTALAYFYFSFSDREKQNPENMLRSLIVQLCGRRPDTPKPLLDLCSYRDVNQQPDLESLETTLQATIQDFTSVYLVIDALDECPLANDERDKLLKLLVRVHKWTSTNLHVLYTSRPEPDVETKLAPLLSLPTTSIIDLQKQLEEVNRDICTYIDEKIASDFLSWPPDIITDVKTALTEKADGMFQYVALQLKALEIADSLDTVTRALKDLPAGLDETYNRALLNIHPLQRPQALHSLMWLAFSTRPLTISELAEASIIDPKASPPFNKNRRLFSPVKVLYFLRGLTIIYDKDSDSSPNLNEENDSINTREMEQKDYIRLAHFSIKEFLLSDRIKDGPTSFFSISEDAAHIHIAESCLIYHLYINEVEWQVHTPRGLINSLSLWKYAVDYWTDHTEALSQDAWPKSLQNLILRVLTPQTEPLLRMLQAWDNRGHLYFEDSWTMNFDELPSSLYFVASWGCFHLSSLILKYKLADVNKIGGYNGTALNAACREGHESIVRLLLDAEADQFLGNDRIFGALEGAIDNGGEGCVKMLLERENVVAECEEMGYLPLLHAASRNLATLVELLLQHGADVNKNDGETALQAAAYVGGTRVIMLLLEKKPNVNDRGGFYGNAVQAAAAILHTDIVELLLAHGAKVDPPGREWEDFLERISHYPDGPEGSVRVARLRDLQTEYGEASRNI